MNILIKNGRVINPATQLDQKMDVYISEGIVKRIEGKIDSESFEKLDLVIEANEKWVVPGLIDVHVHLREPGFEYKETIETGTKSAARGGFTTICAMPNTKPTTDNAEVVKYILDKTKSEGHVNVLPIGAITKGQLGQELSDIAEMKSAGICALSEDGKSVLNAGLLKKAMVVAKEMNLTVLSHCEDETLVAGGVMNEGTVSAELNLKGICDESEEAIVARDILLANKVGARLHICHVSTKGSVEIIKLAKAKGCLVTAEVAPHHFTLTDEAVKILQGNAKMNPPLRTKVDVEAMKNALKDGTIDMIATDHAPHHCDEKNCDMKKAANGIVGLETSVALTITELVQKGFLSPMEMIEKMSYNPAKMLGIQKGNIDIGFVADITIIEPNKEYTIDIQAFASKSKNAPYDGMKVQGRVVYTLVAGELCYSEQV